MIARRYVVDIDRIVLHGVPGETSPDRIAGAVRDAIAGVRLPAGRTVRTVVDVEAGDAVLNDAIAIGIRRAIGGDRDA